MMHRLGHILLTLAMLLLPPAMLLPACGDDGPGVTGGGNNSNTGGSGGTAPTEGICLLNNCTDDTHCVGCPDNRDECLEAENRCVACDPNTGKGCADGEQCSPFGICVPAGLDCPTDNAGNPEVTCTKNSDCLACSPMHQVCDTVVGKCQACIETNTQHCLSSDICIDTNDDGRPETCSPKCPATCTVDNDCASCGGPGNEAHACFQHKCAECSDTYPCAAGLECSNGVCTPPCGIPGPEAGTCTDDEDCQFCGDPANAGTWSCKTPINDPSHGYCAAPANGCSDLGTNVAVLPEPYNQITELCSNDSDCVQAQAGIQFNVGEALRDAIGSDELDLGFTKINIGDANVTYAMPICASVQLTNDIECGICVPCKEDADCAPIPVDPLISDLFAGDPVAQIAGALLVDLLWGEIPDHNLNFFCQPVAAGYGACLPCGNPLQPCGAVGGGGGSGMCDHDVCSEGGPLDPMCSQCAADVCAADGFCCGDNNGTWDSQCVSAVDSLCNNICSGTAGCPHDECTTGAPLPDNCSTCVAAICNDDPYCCNTNWDTVCTTKAADTTTYPDCASACQGGCAHDECAEGAALDQSCSACALAVCTADSFCCDTLWDGLCVSAAMSESACGC